jgi:hypothetical protein
MIPACMSERGRLFTFAGTPTGSSYLQGIRIQSGTRRACTTLVGPVVGYVGGGVPVDANGSIVIEAAAPAYWGQSAFPYTASGKLAIDVLNLPNQFLNGVGYFNGRMCLSEEAVIALPGAFNLSGTPAPGQNNLNWTASSDARNYVVFKNGDLLKILPSNILATFDPDVLTGVQYTYALVATNADGQTRSTPNSINLTAI